MSNLSSRVLTAVAALALVLAGAGFYSANDSYDVKVVLESATNVVVGAPVQVNGFDAGAVEAVEVKDGKALVTLSLDEEFQPLHAGAVVNVAWKAVLSERRIEVVDGPERNAKIPDGGMVPGEMPKATEIDHILNSLDKPTRARLASLVGRLQDTLEGNESDVRATIRTGGPALKELGHVLQALGTDGPAIRNLVRRLNGLMNVVAERDDDVQSIVTHLSELTDQVASRRRALQRGLRQLPNTLHTARRTLDQVPPAVDEAEPLLRDLAPATAQLRPVARNLKPLLRDVRPLARDLVPTLAALRQLLGITPGLLDDSHATLPAVGTTLKGLAEPVAFMRPYTPELQGFFSTWASAFANYDSNGNFARILGQAGTTSFNENPGVMPPGVTYDPYPEPGAIVGQPWTDANGSTLR